MGFFVSTLPLRVQPGRAESFRDLLRQIRATTVGALAHQELPLEQLVNAVRAPRDPSRHPLFQVLLALQNAPMQLPELPNLVVSQVDVETVASPFDLSLLLEEQGDTLGGLAEYSTDLFTQDTIERLVAQLAALLAAAVAQPDVPLCQLPLSARRGEQPVLVHVESDPGEPTHVLTPVHQMIAEQAGRTPDAPALVGPSTSLTYAEMEHRAERLARRLRALGVGPEVKVGVCLDARSDLVVAVLGILKAGGAYLPLDTSLPAERLKFMLDDACSRVVVTARIDVFEFAGLGIAALRIESGEKEALNLVGRVQRVFVFRELVLRVRLQNAAHVADIQSALLIDDFPEDQHFTFAEKIRRRPVERIPIHVEP